MPLSNFIKIEPFNTNALASFTFANVTSTGNVTGAYIIGDGSSLTNINAITLGGTAASAFATQSYVGNAVANLVASAPAALDTLNELANALGNDASFSTTITNQIGNKLSTSAFNSTANTWLALQTTSNVAEGANLYYTVARANTAIDNRVTKSFVDTLGVVASSANSVQGGNVTGQVGNALIAGTVYTNAQPNITSVGSLASLTVTGLTTATGGIKTANIQDASGTLTIQTKYNGTAGDVGITGNLVVGAGGSGNLTASYLIGNGSQLTGLPASYGNSNVATYLPTYTGNLSPGNLTVSGTTNLGAVGNVKISGGASSQLLQTDGLGNVSWVTPTGTTITVDNFTANGVQTAFTLSTTPVSKSYTMVSMAGTLQPRSVYSVAGNVLTFSSAPPNTAPIEVTTFSSLMGYGTSDIVANSFTANSFTANLITSNTVSSNSVTANTLSGNIISSNANLAVNTLSANSITNTGTGIPTINSATSINFTASTVVRTTSSPFQFYNCTTTVRDTIAASNGYVIYNTTTNKLQVYANGTWVDLH